MKPSGSRFNFVAERLDRRLGCGGSNQHAVAAGAVHFLDHEVAEIVEHVGEILRLAGSARSARSSGSVPRRDRFHDIGHVGIDRLVVGNPGATAVASVTLPAA